MILNNEKTIEYIRELGGDYFLIKYIRKSKLYLKDFIDKFNFDEYYCFKASRIQRLITDYQEFLDFKYSSYIFFKKELYDLEHFNFWLEYMKTIGGIKFLVKPLPPFNPYKKIIVK